MIWLVFAILFWLGAWAANTWLANSRFHEARAVRILVPVLFGVALLVLWEGLVRGLGISPVILPAPSTVAQTFQTNTGLLWEDFRQTVFKGALTGLSDRKCRGLCDGHCHRPFGLSDGWLASDREFRRGIADCRDRADPRKLVRF